MGSDTLDLSDGQLFIDLETFNPVHDLRKVGTDVYARNAQIILASYADSKGPVQLWQAGEDPAPLRRLLRREDVRVRIAHNAYFEQNILRRTGWCKLYPEHWHCTMAQAYAHGMPGELGALCRFLGVPAELSKKGDRNRLIRLFCMTQRDGRRVMPEDRPDDWAAFREYAYQDTVALREVYRRLPRVNLNPDGPATERRLWVLDQRINMRGICVDLDLARAAVTALAQDKQRLDRVVAQISGNRITSATQRQRVLDFLRENGVELEDLRATTVESLLSDNEVQGEMRALLNARQQASKASTGKYSKLLSHAGPDGRVRGCLQFAGAKRTARWAGRTFQPHNMPRPKRKQADIELGIRALKAGCADLLDDPFDLCSDALRSLVVATPGTLLRVADFNAIEGRKLAWLAGESWKLALYRDPDADMYIGTYQRVMGLRPDADVSKDQRQQGKVFELAYGYEGGVEASLSACASYRIDPRDLGEAVWRGAPPAIREKAHRSFQYQQENGGEDIQERIVQLGRRTYTQLEAAKHMWRGAAPATCRAWGLYRDAAIGAVRNPGKRYGACKCTFLFKGNFLYCRLPSGRLLMYPDPRIRDGQLSYQGEYGGRTAMYGGKWAENITQAVARDRLAYSMLAAADAGYRIVLHVHDEIVAETPVDSRLDVAALIGLMEQNPTWSADCPIRVAGYEADRYRKE